MEDLVKAILGKGAKSNMVHAKPTTKRNRVMPRMRLESGPHAYLKIADGCNHACTFCAIPRMKGRLQSVAPDLLLEEARGLLDSGVRELNLIAQDISEYGRDLRNRYDLPRLLRDLNSLDGDFWIRCLYCYPGGVTDELLQAICDCSKVVHYLDVPLQHFDGKVLEAMRRPNAGMDAENLVKRLRDALPDIVLRTTLIVGFPGETPQAHGRMLDIMQRLQFDRLGAFEYSAEEDTPAATMPRQVGKAVKQARWEAVMELQAEISETRNQGRIGKAAQLLIMESDTKKGLYQARSHGEAPDIDGIVYLKSKRSLESGMFVQGRITRADSYDSWATETAIKQ
jgi:ribosomal protein S12 methylthiotransferase